MLQSLLASTSVAILNSEFSNDQSPSAQRVNHEISEIEMKNIKKGNPFNIHIFNIEFVTRTSVNRPSPQNFFAELSNVNIAVIIDVSVFNDVVNYVV